MSHNKPKPKKPTQARKPYEKKTYSIEETAKVLGIGRQTAYDLARKQELPGVRKLGGRYIVSKMELDAYLHSKYDINHLLLDSEIQYVYESPTIPAEDGMYAHRIVAYHRERPPFPERAYATHMEVFPDNGEMYRLNGHYDLTLEDAIKDAKTRYKLYGGE